MRTDAYKFTVDMENGKPVGENAKRLEALRESLRGTGKYAKLQGRGWRRGNPRYNQSLPLTFAKSADVYVYNR
jgi:hypothetical protein